VLNQDTFRRAMSPLAPPASWPTPDNRRAARAQRALYAVVDELVARRRHAGAAGDEDLLSRLLRARDPEGREPMDVQQVRDEALIFLLAGHETTSTALTFTLHLLVRIQTSAARPPRARFRPRRQDPGARPRARARAHDDGDQRGGHLSTPAYALGRLSVTEHEIGGGTIPAGAYVVVSQFATHRHPHFWDHAEAFDPARFSAERERARHPHAYFPFGAGPRACTGSHFAMLEAIIALALLL
jgi:cytochrome P450